MVALSINMGSLRCLCGVRMGTGYDLGASLLGAREKWRAAQRAGNDIWRETDDARPRLGRHDESLSKLEQTEVLSLD